MTIVNREAILGTAGVGIADQIHDALKPGGIMLITVPQHKWLWSAVDEQACHVRRYTKKDLENKIKSAGFKLSRSTSFVSLLLPAMLISRILQKKSSAESDSSAELKLPKILNTIFYYIMMCEVYFIKLGGNLPIGGSRLIVARKIGTTK